MEVLNVRLWQPGEQTEVHTNRQTERLTELYNPLAAARPLVNDTLMATHNQFDIRMLTVQRVSLYDVDRGEMALRARDLERSDSRPFGVLIEEEGGTLPVTQSLDCRVFQSSQGC